MMNKQWHPDDLREVFPEIPASCSRVLMDTAGSLKEESEMKRGYSPRPATRFALVLALVIISMMGVALAAFYPQITGLFGLHYGEDTQAWLEQGDIALPADSVQVEGVTFTLEEVAYRNHGLYGLVTITPSDDVVLLSEDSNVGDAYGYAVHYGDKAPEGTISIQEKAAQDGSAIKHVGFYLDKIGVNDGALLEPNGLGCGVYPQRDGSIQILFEVEDGIAITEGESYTIQMTAIVRNVSPEGVVDSANSVRQEWTVTIKPEPYAEVVGTPAAATEAPVVSAASVDNAATEMKVIVPDAYTANGTLPVYEAAERDFSQAMDYTWFNQSGVAKEALDTRHIGGSVDFNDKGHLDWGSYYLYYYTFDGTYEAVGELEDGTKFTETLPKSALVMDVGSIASWMVMGFPGTDEIYTLEHTQLSTISLDEAKAQAEALMSKLGMTGYTCTTALDMGVERIHKMGAMYNAAIDSGVMYTNAFRHDYSTATTADEGYYLCYHKFGTDGDMAGQFEAVFYVTADGIKSINLRDAYEQGDVINTPAKLVDASTVAAALPGEMADSRYPEELKQITRATLTWMPVRADKGDGMVMTPVWVLSYLTAEGEQQGYECWAVFDAIDGTLIDAVFI
ncbi:MAG: hypothetical protein IJB81_04560 [Clostridia bacterium]|nr:hypothetical protein [Clostridia bacterium]